MPVDPLPRQLVVRTVAGTYIHCESVLKAAEGIPVWQTDWVTDDATGETGPSTHARTAPQIVGDALKAVIDAE